MATTIKPVYFTTLESKDYIDHLADDIRAQLGKDADLLLDYPALYVHVWQSKDDSMNGTFSIYVGETNDLIQRTKEHWANAKIPKAKRTSGNWQFHMAEDVDINGKKVVPRVSFFGHPAFHKSLTLDVENRFIDYCYAMPTAHIHNGRTNPQGNYSGDENLDVIFGMIWRILREDNSDLFLAESEIKKSAIYKASPNHRLTEEQKKAKQLIIDRTVDAVLKNKTGQLIFVEGEAGTGKTVLASGTLFDLLENEFFKNLGLKCYMLINHDEQKEVYQNMTRKLGYDDKELVRNPTGFLLDHSTLNKQTKEYEPKDIADIVFVDEAHLLWISHNQKFDRKFPGTQLDEIIKRSRVTVIMFDENQVLRDKQVFLMEYQDRMRKLAQSQGPDPKHGQSNYIVLNDQLRMRCAKETMEWIDHITKDLWISPLKLNKGKDSAGYEVIVFDDPATMHQAIKAKASKSESVLSRMVATCDWSYSNTKRPPVYKKMWDIRIGDWSIPWNEEIFWRELKGTLNKRQERRYKMLDWAEKDYSIDEAGSTFVIQGFDLSYVGVIIGSSVKYDRESHRIYIDESQRALQYMKGKQIMTDGSRINITELISRHELRVLMTRGTKGLYIYACDPALREALKESLK